MSEPIFECANIPVAVASKVLKVDCQTVRLLLQSDAVNWGIAYHRTPIKKRGGVHLNEYFKKIPTKKAATSLNA